MAFDPEAHLRSLKGQSYLDVKWRLLWARQDDPKHTITSEIMQLDLENQWVLIKSTYTSGEGWQTTGFGTCSLKDFRMGWIEKAETRAQGRALGAAGYGTQFALEPGDDDDEANLADAPIPDKDIKKIKDSIETRKKVAAEIILKLGYRPNFPQWTELAREHGISPVPAGPDTMDAVFLTRLLDALTNNAA